MSQAHFHDRASRAAALARRLGLPVVEPEAPDEDRLELHPPPSEEFDFDAAMSLLPDEAEPELTDEAPTMSHIEIVAAEIERQLLAREQAAQARAAAEQAGRDEAAAEKQAAEQSAREFLAREQAARERVAREQAAQEQAAREQAIRAQLASEQLARQQAARVESLRAAELARIAADEAAKAATLSRDVDVLRTALARKEANLSELESERERLRCENGKLNAFADRVQARREGVQTIVVGLIALVGLIAGGIYTADYYMGQNMGTAAPIPATAETKPVGAAPSTVVMGVVHQPGVSVLRAPEYNALSIGRAEAGEALAAHNVVTVALEEWVEVELHHQQGYIRRSDIELPH